MDVDGTTAKEELEAHVRELETEIRDIKNELRNERTEKYKYRTAFRALVEELNNRRG